MKERDAERDLERYLLRLSTFGVSLRQATADEATELVTQVDAEGLPAPLLDSIVTVVANDGNNTGGGVTSLFLQKNAESPSRYYTISFNFVALRGYISTLSASRGAHLPGSCDNRRWPAPARPCLAFDFLPLAADEASGEDLASVCSETSKGNNKQSKKQVVARDELGGSGLAVKLDVRRFRGEVSLERVGLLTPLMETGV